MANKPPLSTNPAAFNRSLKQRIRNRTKELNRTADQLQRQLYIQRFLARVFTAAGDQWLLKGGTSLLIRHPDARHSKDIDLLHTTARVDDALGRLTAIAEQPSALDPFTFVVTSTRPFTGDNAVGATMDVDVYIGALRLAAFPIDVSTELNPIGEVEYLAPRPVIAMDELKPLPEFALYPLPQQVSDKLCAMYEKHGPDLSEPSTRWHDLVDLVLIIDNWPLDADTLHTALTKEAARRGLTLPSVMEAPGPRWNSGYPETARPVHALPDDAKTTDGALQIVGTCLNPLLANNYVSGQRWDPHTATWTDRPPARGRDDA